MARFRHVVAIEAVPRGRFDEVLAAVFAVVESLRFEGGRLTIAEEKVDEVRLVRGRHLGRGARYRVAGAQGALDIGLASWNRTGKTRLDLEGASEGVTAKASLDIDHKSDRMGFTGTLQVDGPWRRLRRGSLRVKANPGRWWAAAAGNGSATGGPPIVAKLIHGLARADVRLDCAPGEGGRWEVEVTTGVRGRWLLRPLVAVALFGGQIMLQRRYRTILDRAAEAWNDTVPGLLLAQPGEQLEVRRRTRVRAVPRDWVAGYLGGMYESLEATLAEERIVAGEDEVESPTALAVTLSSWDRAGATRVDFVSTSVSGTASARSVDRPALVQVTGVTIGEAGTPKLSTVEWQATADLDLWWELLKLSSPPGNAAPLRLSAANVLGQAQVEVTGRTVAPDLWELDAVAKVRGVGLGARLIEFLNSCGGPRLLAVVVRSSLNSQQQLDHRSDVAEGGELFLYWLLLGDEKAGGISPSEALATEWGKAVSQNPRELAARTVEAGIGLGAVKLAE